MDEYKQDFNEADLLASLMQEVVLLRAETTVLRGVILELQSSQHGPAAADLLAERWPEILQQALQDQLAQHPWFEGYWQQLQRRMLGE